MALAFWNNLKSINYIVLTQNTGSNEVLYRIDKKIMELWIDIDIPKNGAAIIRNYGLALGILSILAGHIFIRMV